MQVILTPTAVPNMFGPGLNGFTGAVPGPPTQVSPEWLNHVQMELVNVVLGQGIALDSLVFDQLKTAIDNYEFLDPVITSSLTIAGGAELFVANTAVLYVQAGAGMVLENGSTFAVESNVTLDASDNTWVWGSSNANDWTIHGNVTLGTDATNTLAVNSVATFAENVTVASSKLLTASWIDQLTNSGWIAAGEVRFYSDASPAFTAGILQWDGRDLRLGVGGASTPIARRFDSWVAGDIDTASGIADTGASVTVSLLTGQKCIVEMRSEMRNDTIGSTIAFRIEANGATIGGTAVRYEAADIAGTYQDVCRVVEYTAGANGSVVFTARYGAAGGRTYARNIHITARRSS